jgi:phytoene dehydrogenase-like protein
MRRPSVPSTGRAPGRSRVVVVGAGHNGLVCALLLAQVGVEVVVVEQADTVGGAVSSADGPLPGFRHDICSAFFPLTKASPAFTRLDLDLDWIAPPIAMAHPFANGGAIVLARDIEATAASLEAAAPGAGAAWQRFVGPALDHWRALVDTALLPFPAVRPALAVAAHLRVHALRLARAAVMPAGSLGLELFRDEHAAAWLAGSTSHADLAPGDAGGGALTFALALLGHAVGWPFPRGGAQAISDALAARLVALGGTIRTGAHVEEVAVGGRAARGIRLAGGERIEADAVIVTTSAHPFVDLLPPTALPRRVESRLRHWRHDMGTFKVDFALAGPVPWAAEECRRAGAIHVGTTLDEIFASFAAGRAGRFPERPTLVLGQQSLFDDTRAPSGRHTLYAYARSPLPPLDIDADAAADLVEQRIEELAPGFRKLVLARAVRDPAALERRDPSLVGGDLGGGSYRADQQLFLRPHPRLFRTRTPVRGLYLAGASVHPGGGVHGAQGLAAAHHVLHDLR